MKCVYIIPNSKSLIHDLSTVPAFKLLNNNYVGVVENDQRNFKFIKLERPTNSLNLKSDH